MTNEERFELEQLITIAHAKHCAAQVRQGVELTDEVKQWLARQREVAIACIRPGQARIVRRNAGDAAHDL